MTLCGALLAAYGGLWRAAQPLLRRHKRLKEGFAQRLVPDDWLPADWLPADWLAAKAQPAEAQPGKTQPPKTLPAEAQPAETLQGLTQQVAAQNASCRVWIQAASGGEARLVHSLAPALLAAAQACSPPREISLLCTTCTRQGLDVLEKMPAPALSANGPGRTGGRIVSRYFPLDRPDLMEKALGLAAPSLIILLETELWPALLHAARQAGVPVVVLNARMTPKSFRAYSLTPGFWRGLAPEAVLATSPEDAERFSRLFGTTAKVMPNIKFDVTASELAALASASAPEASPGQAPQQQSDTPGKSAPPVPPGCLLAALASVRQEEEEDLLYVLASLYAKEPGEAGLALNGAEDFSGFSLSLAIAPRHMHRVAAWQNALVTRGIPFVLRSAQKAGALPPPPPQVGNRLPVILWDTFGELSHLYAAADAVFVGGSLAPLGGQNFLEALAQGVPPFVGPHLDNFLWVGEDVFAQGLAHRVNSRDQLTVALRAALAERARSAALVASDTGLKKDAALAKCRMSSAQALRARFGKWLAARTGGSEQAAALALSFLCR